MKKILIIDDDPDIIESMKIVLETRNYCVSIAKNGGEGLKKVKLERPDLIILDVIMETADKGFEVARVLKKDQNYKNIPVLMVTAIKDRVGLDFKNEAGDETWLPVDDYVDKPLKPEDLISKVESLMRKDK